MIERFFYQMIRGATVKVYLCALMIAGLVGTGYADGPTPSAPAGSGTKTNPFLISNVDELSWIASEVNSGKDSFAGKYFEQTNNIDLSDCSTWDNGKGWTPIGLFNKSVNKPFSGTYDGNGKSIVDCVIQRPDSEGVGLFGNLSGSVKGLSILSAHVTGKDVVGILAGQATGAHIEDCEVSGSVSGSGSVGGFVGFAFNVVVSNSIAKQKTTGGNAVGGCIGNALFLVELSNCYSTGDVHGGDFVGGIVGGLKNQCRIDYSASSGNISGASSVGGIVGVMDASLIKKSASYGSIDSSGSNAGGIAGELVTRSIVERCEASGGVAAGGYVGGIVGLSNPVSNYVRECFAGNAYVYCGKDLMGQIGRISGSKGGLSMNYSSIRHLSLLPGDVDDFIRFDENSEHGKTAAYPPFSLNVPAPISPSNDPGDNVAPMIISHPISQRTNPQQPVNFLIQAESSTPLSFQWYKDDVLIAGENGQIFVISHSEEKDSGNYYCIATNSEGSTVSATASLVVSSSEKIPFYRFSRKDNSSHFYTTDEAEKEVILNELSSYFTSEGVSQYVVAEQEPKSFPVFCLLNRITGARIYTAIKTERNRALEEGQGAIISEGVAFYAFVNPQPGTMPVHRFWVPQAGSHFYTISEAEKNILLAGGNTDFVYEGIAWYAYTD